MSRPTDLYVVKLLGKISEGKRVMSCRKGEKVFSQGVHADAIYFVQAGRVKITVVSSSGKEAVLALLGPHDFFGEGSLVGQSLRMSTATAMEATTLFRVEKRASITPSGPASWTGY